MFCDNMTILSWLKSESEYPLRKMKRSPVHHLCVHSSYFMRLKIIIYMALCVPKEEETPNKQQQKTAGEGEGEGGNRGLKRRVNFARLCGPS